MTRRKTRHSEHMPPRASITVLSPCSEAETQNIDDGEEVQDFSADPQNIYSAQEDDARFEDLLSEKLTDFERSVLTLRAEKLSYEEIAERLGTNPKAVDNALQRIRRKLASDSRW